MGDGLNTCLQFNLMGSRDNARFLISPTGDLRIEFASSINFLVAPAKRLRFDDDKGSLLSPASTKISYECPTEKTAFWQVVISSTDGEALKEALRNNAQSFKEAFGDEPADR